MLKDSFRRAGADKRNAGSEGRFAAGVSVEDLEVSHSFGILLRHYITV